MDKETIISKINSDPDWYPKSYAGGLFGIYIQAMGLSLGSKEIPSAMRYGMVYQNRNIKDHWDWFWNVGEMKSRRADILKEAVSNSDFTKRFYEEYLGRYEAFVGYFGECAIVTKETLFGSEMFAYYKKLYELVVAQASYGYVVDALLTSGTEDWLEKMIVDELGDKATSEVITRLTAPVFTTFVNDYEIEILNLALDTRSGNLPEQLENRAKEIEGKYFWIKTNYLDYKRLTASGILEEANSLHKSVQNLEASLSEKKERAEHNRKTKSDLMEKLAISPRLQSVVKLSETFSHIQDLRKECVLRSNTLFYEALSYISTKKGFDGKLIFYLTPEEFFDLLSSAKQPDWSAVQRRYEEGVLVLYFNGLSSMIYKDEIDSRINASNLFPNLTEVEELRGSIAYSGVVRGIVRVLKNTKDIAGFKGGEILVANQTTPEFVPAMKKAIAIVTDQGGVTSHASIIARELKVPCIVGVKNATKVLKDGMMVEVDATKGRVIMVKI